jgi:hypothetical protein
MPARRLDVWPRRRRVEWCPDAIVRNGSGTSRSGAGSTIAMTFALATNHHRVSRFSSLDREILPHVEVHTLSTEPPEPRVTSTWTRSMVGR